MPDQPTVHVLGSGGAVIEMTLPLHETIADQVARGHARIVNADGTPIDESERPAEAPGLPTERPALNATKALWIGWAVVNGAKPDDAEALTKQDLIEQYGQIEPGNGQHVADPATADE